MKRAPIVISLLLFACNEQQQEAKGVKPSVVNTEINIDSSATRLINRVDTINSFIAGNTAYNNDVAFFIDMKIPSGKNRFFIVDLASKNVLHEGLVAHGVNSNRDASGAMTFSNQVNSYCTSLGKYKISNAYHGNFGKAYRLLGLDSSNDNAMERAIVLHKYDCVPDDEQPEPICNSHGCPMVSPQFFSLLEKQIDKRAKNILLEIYY